MDVRLEESWKKLLDEEFKKPYFKDLTDFVKREYQENTIYPPAKYIFNALDSCPVDQVKVVILGQDPYHGVGQAHGLSFSVQEGTALPPSLQNIYKELETDLGVKRKTTGDLTQWAKQGVLLLNATLTVRANQAGSHQNKGWEIFTNAIIDKLNKNKKNLVYILWGNYAQKKGKLINEENNLVIKSAHPSPLSAYNGFFGSRPFSQTNIYLLSLGLPPITW
jgi:uracil-DNA glycosylase